MKEQVCKYCNQRNVSPVDALQTGTNTEAGQSIALDGQYLLMHEFEALDAIYDGMLVKATKMTRYRTQFFGDLTARKAIVVKLWTLGELQLSRLKGHVFEDVLTTQQILEWGKDESVRKAIPHFAGLRNIAAADAEGQLNTVREINKRLPKPKLKANGGSGCCC